jgi:uncharacterized protein (DUF433 family)
MIRWSNLLGGEMVSNSNALLGIGLYTPAEAAFYARVPTRKFIRWTFGSGVGKPVFTAERENVESRSVSFLDFMQALSIRAVRIQFPEVPLPEIRRATELAQKEYGIPFPLAVQDRRIAVIGRRLAINIGEKESPDMIEISREHRGQRAFSQVVELFVENTEFNEAGIAKRFISHVSPHGKIVMDPKVRMGEPLVENCGYTPMALAEAVKIEGSIKEVVRTYGVTTENVKLAIEYIDHLQIAA